MLTKAVVERSRCRRLGKLLLLLGKLQPLLAVLRDESSTSELFRPVCSTAA